MSLPIAIFPLFILADILDDIAIFAQLFGKRKNVDSPLNPQHIESHSIESRSTKTDREHISIKDYLHPSPEMIKAAAEILYRVLIEITYRWGTGDIVDVDVQSQTEQVRVRCSLH